MIFADASEDTNDVGKSIELANLNGEKVLSGQHTILARRTDDRIALGFGGYLVRSRNVRAQVEKVAQGTKVYAISPTRLGNVNVIFPSDKGEQRKIVACLGSLDDCIAAEVRKLEALRSHKKGLMQQLFPRPGESRPRLRFPEFRNAEEWQEKQLNDCFSQIRNGFVGTATPYYVPNGIPYLQGKNVKKGRIDPTGLVRISEAFHDKQKKSQLKSTDILMVQSGHVGECAVVGHEFAGANCHALLVMTPREQQDSSYFVHCFGSDYGRRFINGITTGNTIEHILASDMNAMELLVPTFAEQQQIAACLSSLDDVLAAQSRKVEGLKSHKKGLMQQLFPSAGAR